MVNSKGVKDNKCLEDIDLSEIENKLKTLNLSVEDLKKKSLTFDTIMSGKLVTDLHDARPATYQIHESNRNVSLSKTITKSGYYPIGVVGITSTTNEYRVGQITDRVNGSCTVNIVVANHDGKRYSSDQELYYLPYCQVIILWVKAN